MAGESNYLPQYRSSVYIDGYTYQLSLRFYRGEQERESQLPHSHAQYELHALFCGQAVFELEGKPVLTLQAGECCVIPPRVYHLRRPNAGETRGCSFTIDCPKGAPLHEDGQGLRLLSCAPGIIRCLEALEQEFSHRRIGTDSSIQSLFTLLLTMFLRELAVPTQAAPANRALPANREERIDNYFARHYGQDISAGNLAEHIGITTRQLARIMQQRYGCTFRQHLLEIRLYHARRQLATADSISRIALNCGFSSQEAFATAFRKQEGCTPSQYRKNLTNKL